MESAHRPVATPKTARHGRGAGVNGGGLERVSNARESVRRILDGAVPGSARVIPDGMIQAQAAGEEAAAPPATAPAAGAPGAAPAAQPAAPVAITYGPHADTTTVSAHTIQVLGDLLRTAGETGARVNSTARTPHDQARAMYNNLQRPDGVATQRELYAAAGDRVIDVYEASLAAGRTRDEIIADMEARINTEGPSNVSRHCADQTILNVIDVDPNTIVNDAQFVEAVEAARQAGTVENFLQPPNDPAYHLEIRQPGH